MEKKTVLVLDQDKLMSSMVEAALINRGYEISACDSGQEGLLEAKSKKPELIIVGEDLSDIDGLEFISKLRDSNKKVLLVLVLKRWREQEFYRMLKNDLKVSLVVHRPLKSGVFAAQLQGLLSPESGFASAIDTKTAFEAGSANLQMPLPAIASGQSQEGTGAEFEKLKKRFVQSIAERLSKLESFLDTLSKTSYRQSSLEGAITVAHNLKGTSLSWGFQQLGKVSEQMEAKLKQAVSASADERKTIFAFCLQLLDELNKEARNVRAQSKLDDKDSLEKEDEQELDHAAAKVLVVSSEPLPGGAVKTDSGLALNLIHVQEEEAIEKAAKLELDAALIEIGPQNKSIELARELRDLSGFENLPLGFISSPEAADARADATHAGSSLFLSKPLDPELLQKVISQLISMREGGRFRVLVVDDDIDLSTLTCKCLGQFGMITRTVNDPLLVNKVLEEFTPDLILLDVNMPGMSGFEICRALRTSARWRDTPILFLTAQTDLMSRLTAYEAGADDYLPKPVINVELLTRVKVRLERARELKERSERDLLTGLLLRRAFVDQLNALISECKRFGFHFSLCLLDVDHFKQVNDKHGHHAGDEVLATLGRLLRKRFRVEDLRGRWGGEEFILAFKHEHKDVMKLALQRIMDELGRIDFRGEAGEIFQVTFSAGLASFPAEADNLQELVRVADRRLYFSKERGRKQITTEDSLSS